MSHLNKIRLTLRLHGIISFYISLGRRHHHHVPLAFVVVVVRKRKIMDVESSFFLRSHLP